MKWFKHISDSLDDPFIFDLVDKCGADGYLTFFGILEIYSREFKPELNWNLSITRSYLKQKLHKRQDKLIIKSLELIKNSGKWDIEISQEKVTIFIPKFKDLIDNWTSKQLPKETTKLRSNSEESIQPIRIKNKEEEVDKDNKAEEEKNALYEVVKKVSKIYPRFNINLFIQNNLRRKNHKAILHTLNTLLTNDKIENPMAWCEAILKQENMNYNASDSEARNNEYKKHDLTHLSSLVKGVKSI